MRRSVPGLTAMLVLTAAAVGGEIKPVPLRPVGPPKKPAPVAMPIAVNESKRIRPAHVTLRNVMMALKPGVVAVKAMPDDLGPAKLARTYTSRRESLRKAEAVTFPAPAQPALLYVGPTLNGPDGIVVTGAERLGNAIRVIVTIDKFFGQLRRNIIWRPMLVIPLGDLPVAPYDVTVSTIYRPRGGVVPPGFVMPDPPKAVHCRFTVAPAGAPPAFDRSDTAQVLVLRYSGGMIANPDTTPYCRIYGSGRVRFHWPTYTKRAGDYEMTLKRAELDGLMQRAHAAVTGFDARRAMQKARKGGRMLRVMDAGTTHLELTLATGPAAAKCYALGVYARRFPKVEEWKRLQDVVTEIRGLEKRPLTKIEVKDK